MFDKKNIPIIYVKEFLNKIGFEWNYDVGFMCGIIKANKFMDIESTYLTKRLILIDKNNYKKEYNVYINKYCFKIYYQNKNSIKTECKDYSKEWKSFLTEKYNQFMLQK